jgi:muramidase (phage lysozyme)
VWACIRAHESGGNYATDTGNGYYGAYQFSQATWLSVGGTGHADDAPPAVQDAMAQRLQQRSGWGQWSTHSRCGV